MTAIVTRYVGPTNFRPSRIIATTAVGHRRVSSWNHALGVEDNHRAAAVALAESLGWTGEHYGTLIGGATSNGYAFVFAGKVVR